MDLSKLSVADPLRVSVKHELKKYEQQEATVAREKILAIAKSVGISVRELVDVGARAKSGPVAVQSQNSNDQSQQWTDRGRQPKWVRAWLEVGTSLDALRV